MFLTQEDIIKEIAVKENISINTVKQVIKSLGDVTFKKLSEPPPDESILIKLFSGLSIARNYCPERTYSKGMFKNRQACEKIKIKANISRYYTNCVNNTVFSSAENRPANR